MARSRSIEAYERRQRCALPACVAARAAGMPFCDTHLKGLPEDIVYRIHMAGEDGDGMEQRAAVNAAVEYYRS